MRAGKSLSVTVSTTSVGPVTAFVLLTLPRISTVLLGSFLTLSSVVIRTRPELFISPWEIVRILLVLRAKSSRFPSVGTVVIAIVICVLDRLSMVALIIVLSPSIIGFRERFSETTGRGAQVSTPGSGYNSRCSFV